MTNAIDSTDFIGYRLEARYRYIWMVVRGETLRFASKKIFGLATPHRRMFFSPRLRMSRLPLFNIRWWLVLSNNRITDDHTLGGYLSDQAGTRLTPTRLNFFRERIFRS